MAKLFLGSVGTAEAFEIIDGKPVVAFTSKTLTDSAVNISTTSDVVRGGTGAAGVFTFSHDATVDITLTDVLFKDAYLEAQLGGNFGAQGAAAYQSEEHTTGEVIDGQTAPADGFSLKKLPVSVSLNCVGDTALIWIKGKADDEYKTLESIDGASISGQTITGLAEGTYCVRYCAEDVSATEFTITTNILPKEYFLIITCPLYSGDACEASNGELAGSITFEIPRFKLNGAQDLTMNMSSNTTLSLSGTALAMDSGCSVNGSNLLRIIKVVNGTNLTTGLTDLVAETETATVGDDIPTIYAIYGSKVRPVDLPLDSTSTATAAEGKFTGAGNAVFKLGDKTETIVVSAK